jgi:hypothetical protein
LCYASKNSQIRRVKNNLARAQSEAVEVIQTFAISALEKVVIGDSRLLFAEGCPGVDMFTGGRRNAQRREKGWEETKKRGQARTGKPARVGTGWRLPIPSMHVKTIEPVGPPANHFDDIFFRVKLASKLLSIFYVLTPKNLSTTSSSPYITQMAHAKSNTR